MSKSLYKFSDVENKNASPSTLRQRIKDVLRADDDACATEIERYLLPPGVAGSREYDHAYAVHTLLTHDKEHDGHIRAIMDETNLSPRMLWDQLIAVYRSVGFVVKRGRVIGFLEGPDKETDDNGIEDGIE